MKMKFLYVLFALLTLFSSVLAQAPEPLGVDSEELEPVEPNTQVFKQRERFRCDKNFREFDGVCTNRGGRIRKLWGSTNRPQFSYFNLRSGKTPRGKNLKSAREISNIIFKQDGDIFDERGLSEIATFIGQFIDHTLVATPANEGGEKLDIEIPEDDTDAQEFAKSKGTEVLEVTRSERVRVKTRDNAERAQNSLTSAMDLVNVYGPSKQRNDALREGKDGRMLVTDDGLLPENERLVNAPRISKGFFLAGDHRANEHPILTSLHTLFVREHNSIAAEVKEKFPLLSDEEIFKESKKINEALWQKIVFEEFYPAVTGRNLPRYRGFQRNTDPTVSLLFSTAAFRVGHTMVGNTVKRFGPGNKPNTAIELKDAFFPGIDKFRDLGTIDDFLRGAINSRAQRVDNHIVNGLRNGLFKDINGEDKNFDLISLNIQRGRDHALPNYAAVKNKFNKPKPSKFRDITKNRKLQKKLEKAYGSVNKVEVFPGLMSEDHEEGSSFGRTLNKIWEREFRRIRDGDRFYFRNQFALRKKFINRIPRLKAALDGEDVLRGIILRNTGITNEELPSRLFFV